MALVDLIPFVEAAYPLDDTSWEDSVNGFDLTANGSPASVAGKFGNAADFDGSNTLSLADNPTFRAGGGGSFSFIFWFSPDTNDDLRYLVSKWGATTATQEYRVIWNLGGVGWQVRDSGQVTRSLSASIIPSPNIGSWNLAVVMFDDDNSQIKLSFNGGPISTGPCSSVLSGSADFVVACDAAGNSMFDGRIDDLVFIKDRVLTQAEVDELWYGGTGRRLASWGNVPVAGYYGLADFVGPPFGEGVPLPGGAKPIVGKRTNERIRRLLFAEMQERFLLDSMRVNQEQASQARLRVVQETFRVAVETQDAFAKGDQYLKAIQMATVLAEV